LAKKFKVRIIVYSSNFEPRWVKNMQILSQLIDFNIRKFSTMGRFLKICSTDYFWNSVFFMWGLPKWSEKIAKNPRNERKNIKVETKPGVANPNWCLGRNLKILPKLEAFWAAW
jgi:hypothetical protein